MATGGIARPGGRFKDITGQRFGRLTVVRPGKSVGNRWRWICQCDCGEHVEPAGALLRDGRVRSCGCLRRDLLRARAKPQVNPRMVIDMAGQRVGRLLVLDRVTSDKQGKARWRCRCDCGSETVVSGILLRNGHTQSCGCLAREASGRNAKARTVHGEAASGKASPEWRAWLSMRARCLVPTHPSYADYGGRGVAICDLWKEDFTAFLLDMGRRPSPQHSLDRIDNDLGYFPANCRWGTRSEQSNNRRSCTFLEHDGRRLSIADWAREVGMTPAGLRGRLGSGWSLADALSRPRDRYQLEAVRGDKEKKPEARLRPMFKQPPPKVKALDGRFGRLRVMGFTRTAGGYAYWWCLCDCGTEIEVQAHSLRTGNTTSCGCAQREHASRTGRKNRKHGESSYCVPNGSPEYRIWSSMIARCANPKNPAWGRYGGRGITVCDSWRHSFEQFLADMGRRPSPSHSLERKNNNLGYSPENCVWATAKEQNNNTSANRIIEYDGMTLTLSQWADRAGVSLQTFHARLRRGWSMDKALSISVATGEAVKVSASPR